jgi:cob(I)alamin adenosyltransferase
MPDSPAPPTPVTEQVNARTQAALARLHRAMHDIEEDVRQNDGVHPLNYGRVTQSELCRRADVKKATLQNSLHKDTTRVEITSWLDKLNAKLLQTRTGVRERVIERADGLIEQLDLVTKALQAAGAELEVLRRWLREAERKSAELKKKLVQG